MEDMKKTPKREVKRTPIFEEVHSIRNKLTLLRSFLRAIENPARWKELIPKYRKDCERALDQIDASALKIGKIESRKTSAEKNIDRRR